MAGQSCYICCNLILNSSTLIDSFQSQSLFGSVNVGSAGMLPSAAYKIFPWTALSWASSTCPLFPPPLSQLLTPWYFQARLYWGWGVEHQAGVFFPRLPLASRAVYTALISRPSSTLPFTLAVVSIGGLRLRAGYIITSRGITASLGRFRHGPIPSNYSRAKDCYEAM